MVSIQDVRRRSGALSAGRLLVALGMLFALPALVQGDDPQLRDAIDRHVQQKWQQKDVAAAPPADDATFLRRIYLDLTGTIPTHDEAKAFLNDDAPDKRKRLIDRLLDDPRYARHQADVWDLVLFGRQPARNEARVRPSFHRWLRRQFADNVPYDRIVGQLLKAEGNTVDDGAPMYLVQFARRPEDGVEAITQTLLGVQLRCARCHDHPYEDWSQHDFFGMAAFLARLQLVDMGGEGREQKLAVGELSTGEVMFAGPAADQTAGKKGAPVAPKFLHGNALDEPPLPEGFQEVKFQNNQPPPSPVFSRKDRLAEWIAAPDNPYMARAVANRVWAQFMGRGLVHPVDDMSPDNEPTHPELLAALTERLIEKNFDLKWYIRELVNSRTYQLARGSAAEPMPYWFEEANMRPLMAEELLESWRIATGYDAALAASGKEPPKERFHGVTWDYMARFFGEPNDGAGNFQGGLHEHLYLNNGQVMQLVTRDAGGLLHAIVNSDEPWEARVERMFISILTRRPTENETAMMVEHLTSEERPDNLVQEAIWALMTCSEFRFNQ